MYKKTCFGFRSSVENWTVFVAVLVGFGLLTLVVFAAVFDSVMSLCDKAVCILFTFPLYFLVFVTLHLLITEEEWNKGEVRI